MAHVATIIGGITTNYKTTDQEGTVYSAVPKAQQKEAVNFLSRNLFETPYWLMNKSIMDMIIAPTQDRISQIQDNFLSNLLGTGRLLRLISSSNRYIDTYRIDEYLEDLGKSIWSELPNRKPIDNYRRNLQKAFVERLGGMVNPSVTPSSFGGIVISFGPSTDPKKTDIISVVKGTLRTLKAEISAALPAYTDRMSRYHLLDVSERIEKILNPK
jgi:hypothetical protein